jgi:glycosyltransferase involved in cell wall biosynthesis
MTDSVKISLVTTCKGRLSYLRESILTWLALDYDHYEILVVDYDCPDGTEAFIERNKDTYLKKSKAGAITVVKVYDKPLFNLNDARNRGIEASDCELVYLVDSDVCFRDRDILKKVNKSRDRGKIFFTASPVLHSGHAEAVNYYRLGFQTTVKVPALLPMISETIGLSGTVCFLKSHWEAAGKYDPRINELGYGCDDIEFYLRLLNTRLYGSYGSSLSTFPSAAALDKALEWVRLFPRKAFHVLENTEDEKERFYPVSRENSSRASAFFVRGFFEKFETSFPVPDFSDMKGFVPGEKTVLSPGKEHGKPSRLPVPAGFRYWFPYWSGVKRYDGTDWAGSAAAFETVTRQPRVPPRCLGGAYFYLGDISRSQGQDRWKEFYRKGLAVFRNLKKKSERELYRMASVYKKLGDFARSKYYFKELPARTNSATLVGGAYFHLGEMYFMEKRYKKAGEYFSKCLRFIPRHREAARYLEILGEEGA